MKEWTAAELIEKLQTVAGDTKIRLIDADTMWTIPKFDAYFDKDDGFFWFHPCDYHEMTSSVSRVVKQNATD